MLDGITDTDRGSGSGSSAWGHGVCFIRNKVARLLGVFPFRLIPIRQGLGLGLGIGIRRNGAVYSTLVAIYLSEKSFAYVHRNQYVILLFSK